MRVFILVQPPFMAPADALHWAKRSLDFAFDCGATAVTLIPTRGGNGAMEELALQGEFLPPRLEVVEAAVEYGMARERGRVFADVWNIENIPSCPKLPGTTHRAFAGHESFSSHLAVCELRILRKPLNANYDIAVVGSGFGGSLLAMIAQPAGALGGAAGKRQTPALCHRGIVDAIIEHFAGRIERALRSWRNCGALQVGELAAELSADGLRVEAGIHVLSTHARRASRGRYGSSAATAGGGKPA